MSNLNVERVLSVHHWNDTLFGFKTTRNAGLRFENGQFVMIGLEVEGRPLMAAALKFVMAFVRFFASVDCIFHVLLDSPDLHALLGGLVHNAANANYR